MSVSIKKAVKQFRKKYGVSAVTVDSLKAVLKEQGYTVVEFNAIYNDESTAVLIDGLQLNDYVRSSKCFTYADGNYRLVFLNEDLNDEEKTVVLAHEEGHIYLNHMGNRAVIGRDVIEEKEANEFSHYLLKKSALTGVSEFYRKHKAVSVAAVSLLLALVIGATVIFAVTAEKYSYGEYYITATGSKYHRKECIFVKNKTNISRLTEEDFETGEYEPCDMCIPQE